MVDPLQRALGKQPGPLLQKLGSSILGLGGRDYNGIRNGLPIITNSGGPDWLFTHEGGAARYYHLLTPRGSQVYVDGVTSTDYPDFVFITLGYGDAIKETILRKAVKWVSELGRVGKAASCFSYAKVKIVDRYGNEYISSSYSLGLGATIGNLGFGWVSSYGKPHTLIPDESTLISRITGRSLDFSVSPGVLGFGTSFGSGNINTWSGGIQIGVGVARGITEKVGKNPDRSWQEAIEAELGGPFAVYRKDVENRP